MAKAIPGWGRKLFAFAPESLFAFSPESCSSSPRKAFRDHPGIRVRLGPESALTRARFEIGVLRIPAGENGVVLGDRLIRVSSGRPRCVHVQVILKDLEIDLLKPGLTEPG